MPYKIKLLINNKENEYVRNEPPMVENLIDALKIQRIEIEMDTTENGQTDKQIEERFNGYADFAVKFWHNQFSKKDFLSGLPTDAFDSIKNPVWETLGYDPDVLEDEDGDDEKKD
ncbi:phage tail assembly chaperone G [Limosilactobacillus fermentum]|uniref:phage tail assembly chaperone G n=1 Tax=Limosilactobacillus fermentum TaxID=1613 RepID=UPI003267B91D